MREFAAWTLVGLLILIAVKATAGEPRLVEAGTIYFFVSDCMPKVGCYAEVRRVQAIRSDGWFETNVCDVESGVCGRESWLVNPSRLSAITKFKGKGRQAD